MIQRNTGIRIEALKPSRQNTTMSAINRVSGLGPPASGFRSMRNITPGSHVLLEFAGPGPANRPGPV